MCVLCATFNFDCSLILFSAWLCAGSKIFRPSPTPRRYFAGADATPPPLPLPPTAQPWVNGIATLQDPSADSVCCSVVTYRCPPLRRDFGRVAQPPMKEDKGVKPSSLRPAPLMEGRAGRATMYLPRKAPNSIRMLYKCHFSNLVKGTPPFLGGEGDNLWRGRGFVHTERFNPLVFVKRLDWCENLSKS